MGSTTERGFEVSALKLDTTVAISPSVQKILSSPEPTFRELEAAAMAIGGLAEKAYGGSEEAYVEYQHTMYELNFPRAHRTNDNAYRWVARHGHRIEEKYAPSVDDAKFFSETEFAAFMEAEIKKQSRLNHPLSQFIYSGKASRRQMQAFIHHQWFRTMHLYRDGTELAINLWNLNDACHLYRYLYGETGGEKTEEAHSHLLAKLCNALGLKADFGARTTMLEEMAYLNNRARSFRQPDVAWGLASFYVTEMVVPANHTKLYEACRMAGLSEEEAFYYKVHITMVPPRVKREWALISSRLADAGFQKTFLKSLRQMLDIERKYFDAIWREVQSLVG